MGNKNSAPTAGNNAPDPAPAPAPASTPAPAPAPAPATRPISTGFFQAVTATVFRSRLPAQAPPPAPKLEQETTKSFKKDDAVDQNNESSVNPNSNPPGSTESIAPSLPASPIKNEDEQIKSLATPIQHEDEQTKSSATPIQNEDEQTKSSATPIQNEDEQIKSSATPIQNEHEQIKSSDTPIKNEAEQIKISASVRHVTIKEDNADSPKPTKEMKENKSKAFKRVASAGLQVESVLLRKTENLKDRYNLGKTLGQGQFGTTYLCLDNVTNQDFACKTIAKRKLTTPEDVEDVRKEIQIMHHLEGHPNIINIVGAYEDAVAVHLVMELCAGGELFDRIIQRGRYTERKAAELTRVIVGVVEACHSMGVIHRDLKPENFLFVDDEEESPLKAIDFGLSVFFKPGETFIDLVGSPYYVAPEVLKNHYGQECDVWSAGVIVYILLCGVPPFWEETEQGIFEQVLRGQVDFEAEPWPSISDGAKDLVKKMLVRDPQKRLTAHEVLCHPWVIVDGVAPDKPLDSAVLSRLKQFSAMNKLKKMAIRIIAERLSEEEIAGLTEMFKMIDGDGSGQITLQELKTGLERVGANLNDSEIVDLMQAADIDNSGTIDYGEFLAAMLHLNKIQKEDHLMAAFSYFDKDGSGYITREELQQACEQFGVGDVHLDEMIREVDTDNDGLIDYSEFTAMMQDTGFGSKALQNTLSIGLKGSLPTPGTP